MAIKVRPATESDIPQIHSIYTHYSLNTVVTFLINTPPLSYTARKFDTAQERGLPFLVAVEQAEGENGSAKANTPDKICGYAQASPFRGYMLAYGPTVELSLFVHPDYQSHGIGSTLLSALIEVLKETKHRPYEFAGDPEHEVSIQEGVQVKSLLAVMAVNSEGKNGGEGLRDWYVKRGFIERGRMKEVGFKFGKWIDTIYLQYTL
ncbi:hypothetical protein AJ79_00420 [Helicocarpus griseus UAMH5409]|uniref:N-acetyltransferase domain-containing protein n=1 Tax=Helicocarpus griseus UAMH5409 TaxID=1447875 RepID=A0A2B7Y2P8_9EURO|nr:hypothetical protein AJ79_00420 [Helicocarpus griseus UAMH5409]